MSKEQECNQYTDDCYWSDERCVDKSA